jgi:DNA-binding GntR family transcriptional regulator
LVEQVYERILNEICDGTLPPNSRLIQDDLAAVYEVSRQPVQQAIMLLRDRGFVTDAPKRGVIVAPLDVDLMRSVYQVREVLDGLSCRLAAQRGDAEEIRVRGAEFIARGRDAIASGSVARQIAADLAFHEFIGEQSGNLVIGEVARPNLHHMRRIMGEILRVDRNVPADIWDEHADILQAIVGHDAERAENLGRAHISRASTKFVSRLQSLRDGAVAGERSRSLRRAGR